MLPKPQEVPLANACHLLPWEWQRPKPPPGIIGRGAQPPQTRNAEVIGVREGEGSKNQSLWDVLQFDDRGLIPVILEDHRERRTLAFELMSREALQKTLDTRTVHVQAPATGELVMRGGRNRRASIEGMLIECRGRCVVLRVFQHIGACDKGYASCFYRAYDLSHKQVIRLEDPVFRGD